MVANPTQTRHIRISVDTKGNRDIRALADAMGGLNRSTQSLYARFKNLTNAFLGFSVAGLGINQLVAFSDEMQNLNNRIVSITGSQEEANATMEGLLKTANATNTSIDSLGESYARLAVSLKDTGIEQSVLLDTIKVLQNTFRLSGSSIAETTATIVQLSQAFASGQLRGQELRSVLEQNATLAILLRKEFGKDIFKKAAEGAISAADVMRVLFQNMDDINKKAEVLTPTIGQSLTKALNGLKVAINELNKDFNISGNFAKGLQFFIDRLPLLASALGAVAIAMSVKLIPSVHALGYALGLLAANPVTGVLVALSAVIVYATQDMNAFRATVLEITATFSDWAASMQEADAAISRFQAKIPGFGGLKKSADEFEANAKRLRAYSKFTREEIEKLFDGRNPEQDQNAKARQEYLQRLQGLYGDLGGKAKKVKDILGELNKEYLRGAINAKEYSSKLIDFNLYKLNREFSEGKFDLQSYNQQLLELQRQNLSQQFNEGRISFEEFNQAISENKIKELNGDLESGKVSLQEYRSEFAKISESFSPGGALNAGVSNYLSSLGTSTQQTATAISNAFTGLETVFTDFIRNGKASFADFTKAILDDLTKIIVRASIIQPIARGILNFGTGDQYGRDFGSTQTSGGTISNQFAKGGVFDKGLKKFAKGGVVNSPTMFNYGKGGAGVMGEAGPEAIIPLSRGSGGELGVKASVTPVNITIINQSSAEVEQKETTGPGGERTIEFLITNKVREGISAGSYDKVMQQAFGVRRKGS